MSMVRRGISNINPQINKVVDTFRIGDVKCVCGQTLDPSTSQNGVIICPKCQEPTKTQDMENIHE
jgi:hypothetical protein